MAAGIIRITGLFHHIRISIIWSFISVLFLTGGCQPPYAGDDKPALLADDASIKTGLSKQLNINRDALIKGSTEQMRIDAATVLLLNEDPIARKILLAVLSQTENKDSRRAVCRALSQAKATGVSIKGEEEFIRPLCDMLVTADLESAQIAAEATLIFSYDEVSGELIKIITNPSLPSKAKLNAIYALKLQPDRRTILKLAGLLDDSDKEIVTAAENALRSLGIPVHNDVQVRAQIMRELQRKGKDEFLRDWLIRQEARVRSLESEVTSWQDRYLASLSKIYGGMSDETAKCEFLAEYLRDPKAVLKLWALDRVSQWRVGAAVKLPDRLGPIIVNLVSDPDRNVRLKVARLLSLMGELNASEKLFEQFKAEQDQEVKTELFAALGGACYYALLPNSGTKVSPEMRRQVLDWAVEYLSQDNAQKAEKGADVVKKLLEQDGLSPVEADKYMNKLADRYKQEKDIANGTLRGELLGVMAGLCTQSVYKEEARKIYKPLFQESLRDEADLVREAAVEGLIYVDKTAALKIFRISMVNDSSAKVREEIANLAGEVGGTEDLIWLADRINSASESGQAWQAMLKIFKVSDMPVLEEWLNRFDLPGSKTRLTDEQNLAFLEIAERKADGENKAAVLTNVRERLARALSKSGRFEEAAKYLGLLREGVQDAEKKQQILADLLDVYLRWPNAQLAAQLAENCLLERDLEPNNVILGKIDGYFAEPPAGSEPNMVLELLNGIEIADRPVWKGKLGYWADRLKAMDKDKSSKEEIK